MAIAKRSERNGRCRAIWQCHPTRIATDQPGPTTGAFEHRSRLNSACSRDHRLEADRHRPLDRLEGLEWLPAGSAVPERSAERRTERAVDHDLTGRAIRATDVGGLARRGDPGGGES